MSLIIIMILLFMGNNLTPMNRIKNFSINDIYMVLLLICTQSILNEDFEFTVKWFVMI